MKLARIWIPRIPTLCSPADVMASNMIDLDWEDEGKTGAEILTSLTALPEWNEMV